MSLTLSSQPGFTDIADGTFDAGNPVTAATAKSLNANPKFAAVRNEQFWGFYKHGETVQLPVSPADGYEYSRAELRYTWSVYWTGAASGALNGVQYVAGAPPTRGSTSGGGQLLQMGFHVHQDTGVVSCNVSYYATGGAQTDTNDGILMVMVHAQRDR